ncbi:MAG TPA: MlaD family protein [Solirubrobacteraceae bacterium]|nr:MlaD family protein [Solirubrobacteraceae bacterium]
MRRNVKRGLSYEAVAIIAIAVTVVATYLAFTKQLPFKGRYDVNFVVTNAQNLKPGAKVRIAGVDAGKVTRVEGVEPGEGETGAARVTMEIVDAARPIHKDATLKIRPRIFFEGNFFVDLQPGSPHAPELGDGETIPINQTANAVQFDQILSSLQSDTRSDLRNVLDELNKAYGGGGAEAINRTTRHWAPAYRSTAIVNDALLGRFEHDLSGYVDGAGTVADALTRNRRQLQDLIRDLRITAGAFAAEGDELQRAIGELPRTLRAGQTALAALNAAFPPLRRFVADLRPGVRSSLPAIEAQIPFVRQLRGLVQQSELRGLAADLRAAVPALTRLNKATIPLLEQVRPASSCQNEVILPWTLDKIEDPDFPAIGPVYQEQPKPLVGLSGESRTHDANGQYFRVSLNAAQFATATLDDRFLLTDRPPVGANPPQPKSRPPLRPDVPCETQEQPDLHTRQDRIEGTFRVRGAPADLERKSREIAATWLKGELMRTGRYGKVKVDDTPIAPSEVPLIGKGAR